VIIKWIKVLLKFLCEVPQFDKLDSREIEIMAGHVEYRKIPVGGTLIEDGSYEDYYIILLEPF
jgi:hypothetical protein|tara:strand:+ start:72 stop:260 length:189 start_codon:yes stop_codon:yes gene_type:complete